MQSAKEVSTFYLNKIDLKNRFLACDGDAGSALIRNNQVVGVVSWQVVCAM
jgi:Trypsin